jgi:putative transcriptional regulator
MALLQPRRAVLCFGALLLPRALLSAAVAKPEGGQPATSLAGQLLVAAPEMGDPRFRRTVILIIQHNKNGAMGIVLNRPTQEIPAAKLLKSLGIDSRGSDGKIQIFAGGPVQPQVGFVVHSAEYRRPGTIDIDGHVAVTTNPQVMRDIATHQGPRKSLVAFGYAGWGTGQLEGELGHGAWFTVPEDPQLVFDFDRPQLWNEAMKHRTISL